MMIHARTAARKYGLHVKSVARIKRRENIPGPHGMIEEEQLAKYLAGEISTLPLRHKLKPPSLRAYQAALKVVERYEAFHKPPSE